MIEINKENIQVIIERFNHVGSIVDFISVLNKLRTFQYGDKAHEIRINSFYYYSNPKVSKNKYHKFSIPKKSGEERIIHAPKKGLKAIQRTITDLLTLIYEPNICVNGFVPKRSIIDNAIAHVSKNYVYNTDLKDFFPSIDMRRVKACLKLPPFNLNDKTAFLVANICCEKLTVSKEVNGVIKNYEALVLPQGAPTSPIITNIVSQRLDRRLIGIAKRFGLTYSRYADDITFSSDHNIYQNNSEFITELERVIGGENFQINKSKTRLQKSAYKQEVTGLIVNEKVNVNSRYIKDIRMRLYLWESYGFERANNIFQKDYAIDKMILAPNMINVINGKLLFLSMVKGVDCSAYLKLKHRFEKLTIIKGNKDISKVNLGNVLDVMMNKGIGEGLELFNKYKNQ
jgi:RNA-directed DNA polymerase